LLRFGTDGVRGLANEELAPEAVLALGRAAAGVLAPTGPADGAGGAEPSSSRGAPGRAGFILGRDTRRSGPLLQAALAAGLAAEGADVIDVGVMPTPAVAFLAAERGLPAAVISASHNPYWDNGVKFFSAGGAKLPDEVEDVLERELEAFVAGSTNRARPLPTGDAVGAIADDPSALLRYERSVVSVLGGRTLEGLRVALDCANGAAWRSAPEIFSAAGAEVVAVLGAEPDGTNINDHCGSTDPRALAGAVVTHWTQRATWSTGTGCWPCSQPTWGRGGC
jgi:phosphoglucosamine mutase